MLPSVESEVIEAIRFSCSGLQLEGRLAYSETQCPLGTVVIAGPHPMLGGNIDNNVLRALNVGLARRGIVNLVFNYRGVGGSEGDTLQVRNRMAEFWSTSHIAEEAAFADDLLSAIATLDEAVGPTLPRALLGYSFGCSLLESEEYASVPRVMIAPTVGTHNYSPEHGGTAPLLVIAPDGDFAVNEERLTEWYSAITGPKQLVSGDWDGHFFRGHEEQLIDLVCRFLRECWEDEACH